MGRGNEVRTRAYLYLLAFPDGLPQGKLAQAVRTQTGRLGQAFDPVLFDRDRGKRPPVWFAKTGFLEDSVLRVYQSLGIKLDPEERVVFRRWLREDFLAWLRVATGLRSRRVSFDGYVVDISRHASAARRLRGELEEEWKEATAVRIASRVKGDVAPSDEEIEMAKASRDILRSTGKLPPALLDKLASSTPHGLALGEEIAIIHRTLREDFSPRRTTSP